jgi:hypothetical protein
MGHVKSTHSLKKSGRSPALRFSSSLHRRKLDLLHESPSHKMQADRITAPASRELAQPSPFG